MRPPKCQYTTHCYNETLPRREIANQGKFYRFCEKHKEQLRAWYRKSSKRGNRSSDTNGE